MTLGIPNFFRAKIVLMDFFKKLCLLKGNIKEGIEKALALELHTSFV